jgi:hypothetical protein
MERIDRIEEKPFSLHYLAKPLCKVLFVLGRKGAYSIALESFLRFNL